MIPRSLVLSPRNSLVLGLTALMVLGPGCGGTPEGRMDVHPVTGKVLIDGKPAAGADIVLHPTVPLTDKNADYPRSGIAEDGSFAISTYGEGDGAPVGTYKVSIFKGGDSESEEIKIKKTKDIDLFKHHKDPSKSGLTLEVKAATNLIPTFDLSSTKSNSSD